MQKNHFLLLKKLNNTESAHLWISSELASIWLYAYLYLFHQLQNH